MSDNTKEEKPVNNGKPDASEVDKGEAKPDYLCGEPDGDTL